MQPKFRKAGHDDLKFICGLLVDLHEKVSKAYGIPTDGDSLVGTAYHLVNHGIVLVGEHSAAGGEIVHYPWNRKVRIGNLVFWNFTVPSEALILPAIMREFRQAGADYFCAASHAPDYRLDSFYKRFKLTECEKSHICNLT